VLSDLGEGDALVVTRLDRLGRSLRDLANIAHEIEQAGAHLKVIEQDVDTSTATGRAFFGMLARLRAGRQRAAVGDALAVPEFAGLSTSQTFQRGTEQRFRR
jgi:DNA invertase Pin-like site-specific DNA recombinase